MEKIYAFRKSVFALGKGLFSNFVLTLWKNKAIRLLTMSTILFFCLSISSCSKSTPKTIPAPVPKEILPSPTETQSDEQNTYSDSMISALIKAQKPQDKVPLDTFKILHNITCAHKIDFDEFKSNMDSVKKYQDQSIASNAELKTLLGGAYCFSEFTASENFKAYIFYSDLIESHSSASCFLAVIDNERNSIEKLNLAIEYGNEQGNYVITSLLHQDGLIERSINHNVDYIHGIGTVDSIYLVQEQYIIDNNGKFEKVFQDIAPSTVVNDIFAF